MSMRNALLIQDQKSEELRANNDHKYRFFHRAVEGVFSHQGRDETRRAINQLVDIANRVPESSIKFDIYNALGEYYAEHIQDNNSADPYVAYHMSSILGPEPFFTDSGIPVISGQLTNCTNFSFILDMRREKIKQLRKTQ